MMIPESKSVIASLCNVSTTEEALEIMKLGYRDMGIINIDLSSEGFSKYAEYLDNYEKLLAESE